MNWRKMCVFTLLIGMVMLFTQPSYAWWKTLNPPDQNKIDNPATPNWPELGDMSCWMVTAADMLAGAGYKNGNVGQIYNILVNNYGLNQMDVPATALVWYLQNHPEVGNPYTVVTRYQNPLNLTPTFIADELRRCQYVGICFHPSGGGSFMDHSLAVWGDELEFDRGGVAPQTLAVTDGDKIAPNVSSVENYAWLMTPQGWAVKDYYAVGVHGVLDEVDTLCVPDPASIVALLFGAVPLSLMYRKRK